jgi:hypothetical protein
MVVPGRSCSRLRPERRVRWTFPAGNRVRNVRARVRHALPDGHVADCALVHPLQPGAAGHPRNGGQCGGYRRARQAGASAAATGRIPGAGGFPAPGTVAPARGLSAPERPTAGHRWLRVAGRRRPGAFAGTGSGLRRAVAEGATGTVSDNFGLRAPRAIAGAGRGGGRSAVVIGTQQPRDPKLAVKVFQEASPRRPGGP